MVSPRQAYAGRGEADVQFQTIHNLSARRV